MIDDLFAADVEAAARDRIARPMPSKPAEPKFSAWQMATAAPRAVNEAIAQVAATGADVLSGLRYMRDATPEQRRQMDRTGVPTEAFSSDAGDELRKFGREFRPDPLTAHAAEQVVYGFARGASKVIGGALVAGPVGVLAAGAEEGMSAADDLRLQGVDLATRTKAGAVQGAGLALAALPIVGQTKLATAGLYAVGGPGGFVAQQALTREILQGAGYDQVAEQFDPFDPVGLAVATLLPAGFAAHGLRQQKLQRAAASLPDQPLRADAAPPADPAAPAPFPSRPSAVAEAVRAYPTEAVDAARVVLLAERRAASNPGAPDSLRAMDQHEAALSRAEDQINAGEAVRVADVAPEIYRPAPLMDTRGAGQRFHGTSREIAALSDEYAMVGDNRNIYGAGFYTTDAVDIAAGYMKKGRGPAPTLYTVQEQPVKLLNMDAPLTEDLRAMLRSVVGDADYTGPDSLIDSAKTLRQWFDEFRGESRNFGLSRDDVHEVWDSLRANLEAQGFRGYEHTGGDKTGNKPHTVRIFWSPETDVIIQRSALEEFRQRLQEAADELRAAIEPSRTDAPTTPQAANPEAAAPARGAGDAAAAGAAAAGRPAAGVEAAGLTPEQARAAAETAKADVIALRKRESILKSLLECLTNG